MNNKIKKYVPSYISGVDEDEYEFETVEELKEIPFVKSVIDKGYGLRIDGKSLMVKYTDGKEYLLGRFENNADAVKL